MAKRLRDHLNIVKIDSFQKQRYVEVAGVLEKRDFMLMEYCRQGDLYDFMTSYAEMGG